MAGFSINGEIRGVKDRSFNYNDQNGSPQKGRDVAVFVETAPGDVHELKLTRDQISGGFMERFGALKGRTVTLPCDISLKKGYLHIWLSQDYQFPAAAAKVG